MMTAALAPGAAVFAQATQAEDSVCLNVDPDNLLVAVEASSVIAIGTVHEVPPGSGLVEVEPEAFLKGAATGEPIRPRYREVPGCANATLTDGQRVLVFFEETGGVLAWPTAGRVFWLDDGQAVRGGDGTAGTISENELVHDVRTVTGQYAFPAAEDEEGAGIDWWKTVVPVGIASLALFGVGLYLMRIWHRIDPS